MSIFNVQFSTLVTQLLPPLLRQPKEIAWLTSLTAPLQYDSIVYNEYMTGSTYDVFVSGTTYSGGDRVIYIDRGVYESVSGSTGVYPSDINSWSLLNSNFIGAIERSKYNARKLDFEYGLNRWFMVDGFVPVSTASTITQDLFSVSANTIYIENTNNVSVFPFMMGETGPYSSYMADDSFYSLTYMGNYFSGTTSTEFIIWIPNYIYSGITDTLVRSFADTINIAGMQYSISGF